MVIFDTGNRHGEICKAAVELFYEKGYHATGMRELSTLLGMTVANLYNFFPSKEELLYSVLEHVLIALIQNVKSVIDPEADPVTQFTAAILSHVRFHGENQKEALVSDSELRGLQGEMRQRYIEYRNEYEYIFRDILERGLRSGYFAPFNPKLTTIAILTMCSQVAYWYRSEGEWTLEDIAKNYCNFIMSGLLPK